MIEIIIISTITYATLTSIATALYKLLVKEGDFIQKMKREVLKPLKGVSDLIINEIQPGLVRIEVIASDTFNPIKDMQEVYEKAKRLLPLGVALKVEGPDLQLVSITGSFESPNGADDATKPLVEASVKKYLNSLKRGEGATLAGIMSASYNSLIKNVWDIKVSPEPDERGEIKVDEGKVIRAGKVAFTRV